MLLRDKRRPAPERDYGPAPESPTSGRPPAITARRQQGAALLWSLSLGVLVAAAVLLDRVNSAGIRSANRDAATASNLADAKRALIAWAVTVPPEAGRSTPGLLPFPDRNRDDNYDGSGDCVTFGLNDTHLLGRLPRAGDVGPCPPIGLHIDARDGAGEPLWYAVSRNLVTGGGGGPINPDMGEAGKMVHAWIALRNPRGDLLTRPGSTRPLPVAAVIIAPGAALADQDRSAGAPSADNYLDRVTLGGTTYDNADADGCADSVPPPCSQASAGEEFILHGVAGSQNRFNDRLTYITVDELVRAVEKRVLGELAIAMGTYRDTYGVYPWLSGFRSPAAIVSGFADGGSATHLRDGTVEFDDSPGEVRVGDIVINVADGGRGTVSKVERNVLGIHGLTGGVDNDFRVGQAYVVEPSFKSDLSRDGLLAVHLENEVFATRFGASWSFIDASPTTETRYSGDAGLVPPLADALSGTASVSRDSGHCTWSVSTRADCIGTQTIAAHYRVDLAKTVHRTVEIDFGIEDETPTVDPPTSGDVRRRTLSDVVAGLPTSTATIWNVRITDDDGLNQGTREFAIDSDTGGTVTLTGIRYDLSVVFDDLVDSRDEVPEWFVENQWHHHVYATFSADAVAGGDADRDADCSTPVDDCLSIGVAGGHVARAARGILIASGVPLTHQDRTLGDCDGDGFTDDYLCAYLEGDNSDKSTPIRADTYALGEFTVWFNDQARIIDPPVR